MAPVQNCLHPRPSNGEAYPFAPAARSRKVRVIGMYIYTRWKDPISIFPRRASFWIVHLTHLGNGKQPKGRIPENGTATRQERNGPKRPARFSPGVSRATFVCREWLGCASAGPVLVPVLLLVLVLLLVVWPRSHLLASCASADERSWLIVGM